MARMLESYVQGAWWRPTDTVEGTLVRDASTGEPVACVSSEGLDLDGAMRYARSVGQAHLGELTFHQRAIILKQLALALTERKAELYELSAKTGATKTDSWVDIDGGIGVLFTYSGKGRRELPNANVQLDGPLETLSKDGTFLGRHIRTTLPGVVVQINAFNFPVWGSLEKFAPAFLAGMPTIVKPATPGAYVTEQMVRIMVESGLLPEGSLQLVTGSVRDVFDFAKLGDVVAFTGSASTANQLRRHDAVQTGGVIFGAETDSINASVLGPDATPDTPEFDGYVRQLVNEMTSKAGQKCTAIRRAIVPTALADAVADAVRARIAEKVVVGDPRTEGVTMGALASAEQRDEVLSQVSKLVDGGGRVVLGEGQQPGGDSAFLDPILLRFDDPEAPRVHDTEAFGPVSSIITYDTPEQAAALVARGGGSLVTSVASADPVFVAELTRRAASANGRMLVLDRVNARTSTGHGSPLPMLVHGGPGRAGGSEELGGVRSVFHYMQRTAIQGSPEMLTAITGVWHAGSSTKPMCTRSASRSKTCGLATRSCLRSAKSPLKTSRTSPTSRATRSTLTWMRKRPRPTPSSRVAWPTATCCSHSLRGSSSHPSQGPCSPTTGSRTSVSSPRSHPATACGSLSPQKRSCHARPTTTARCAGMRCSRTRTTRLLRRTTY